MKKKNNNSDLKDPTKNNNVHIHIKTKDGKTKLCRTILFQTHQIIHNNFLSSSSIYLIKNVMSLYLFNVHKIFDTHVLLVSM